MCANPKHIVWKMETNTNIFWKIGSHTCYSEKAEQLF